MEYRGGVFWLFFLWPCEGAMMAEKGKEVASCSGKKLSTSGGYFDSQLKLVDELGAVILASPA